jgi:succinyl-CoA:mesaconate CoA transferase
MTDPEDDRRVADGRTGPLADVRVVDFSQMLAGPFATMLLADLGADVVKIEPPGGEMTRDNPPHLHEDEPFGGYFQSVNRSKRSLVIDLKSEDGLETAKCLVDDADVVVENFRVGTMDRLGLSYETLSERNEGLVYASIRGFGDPRGGESPHADRPAFDLIAQAMGGIMGITGTEESGPTKVGPGVGDIFPAVLSVVGIVSALHHRDRTGEGQYVDVSMVDGMLSLTERIVHQHSYEGEVPGPQGNTHPLFFPFDRFDAADGYVVIAAPTNSQWEALCEHMDRPDLAAEYPEQRDRTDAADRLRPEVNDWTSQFSKTDLFDLLEDDVPCGPVYDAADIFEEEHFRARDMLPEVEHADSGERVRIPGTPIKFTETPGRVQHPAPFLGQDTEAVLREAGFDEAEIDRLVDEDVVAVWDGD